MKNNKIPEKLLEAITNKMEISELGKVELQNKLAEFKKLFLTSQATVYCEDCGLVFYSGLAAPVVNEKRFVDWKMLSFRHVWDKQHKVKIYMPYFLAADKMLEKENKYLAKLMKTVRKNDLGFDENEQVCYYLEVEKRREIIRLNGSHRYHLSNDQNWDGGSRCTCSVCFREYYDPKDACLCHSEQKPWLPLGEVNSINVKKR